MEANNLGRAPTDTRPLSSGSVGPDPQVPSQPLRPLSRVDSRSALPSQAPRPGAPQPQARPQFQPGGPVTTPPQYAPRGGAPPPRVQAPLGPPGTPQNRPAPPQLRPFGPQSIAPGPRPVQSPTQAQPPQRALPPNNLQFGPRQPISGVATTPDAARPQLPLQPNGAPKNGPPGLGQFARQPSQSSLKGLDVSNLNQNKPANLENQSFSSDPQNANKTENGIEGPGMAKGRSFSIAAAPGAPSPLKTEDDRRKSVSALGGRIDEFTSRSPGLGLIQEGKIESKENIRGSKESVRSEASVEGGRDLLDRSESRLSGSKMTESFIGALPTANLKKKLDDDDDVISQNVLPKITSDAPKTKEDFSDRSPSLTRSDDSPELKPKSSPSPASSQKSPSQNITPEPQRPKTPKVESKPEKMDATKPSVTPNKTPSKSPVPDTKTPQKKPSEFNTALISPDAKKSTPRKSASAPKSRQKDGDNDSGVDESTQGNDVNGSPVSPNKKPSKLPTKEKSSNSLKTSLSRSSSKSATAKTPENPLPSEKKKVPMNKVQVGNAPSPNIKAVKSKIGSLDNATYKPGGGKIKIENRKLEFGNVTPKIAAKNDAYTPSGGSKKIITTKLEWNAKSKIGSLQNATYKPGGGDKKIETVKLDFKDKAKPKVASTANITHKPGGGAIKDHYYMSVHEWTEEDRPKSRCLSARAPRTPRTLSPRRRVYAADEEDMVQRNNERNRQMARPKSARIVPSTASSRRTSLTPRPAFSIY